MSRRRRDASAAGWTARALALAGRRAARRWRIRPSACCPGCSATACLLRLIDRADGPRPLRSAFLRGWLAGFGYFADRHLVGGRGLPGRRRSQGWMAPFARGAAGRRAWPVLGRWRALSLYRRAAAGQGRAWRVLVLRRRCCRRCEWLRGHVLTGFPWNLPGETWAAGSAPSQAAALVGAYGLTWITLAIAAACAALVRSRTPAGIAAPAGVAGAASWPWSASTATASARLAGAPPPDRRSPVSGWSRPTSTRRPSTTRPASARSSARYAATDRTARRGRRARHGDLAGGRHPGGRQRLSGARQPGPCRPSRGALEPGQTLLLGGYRVDGPRASPLLQQPGGASAASRNGLRVDRRLRQAPAGAVRRIPAAGAACWPRWAEEAGPRRRRLQSSGPPPAPIALAGRCRIVQPLICYESLFPGFTGDGAARRRRAGWIVNVSNDAWFGRTSGPWQHLNIASYRAIEEGLPMVRATPTGVSAFIDAYGRADPSPPSGTGKDGRDRRQAAASHCQQRLMQYLGRILLRIVIVIVRLSACVYVC